MDMATNYVTHSCGHEVAHNISGNRKTQEWRAGKLAEEMCAACYQAEIDAKREADREIAAEATSTLPALEGSEKQIAWATTIRADMIAAWTAYLDEFMGDGPMAAPAAAKANKADQYAAVSAKLATTTSASWWIKNRGLNGLGLAKNSGTSWVTR